MVISIPETEYACLIGTVIGINPWGTPEHDTDNPTDDIAVDFTTKEYSKQRENEIAAMFTGLYGKKMDFEECPIDDTIMPSDSLIRITDIHRIVLADLLKSAESAAAFCKRTQRQSQLFDRLEKNYSEYCESLLGFDKQEIIKMAARISVVDDAHFYLTEHHHFQDSQIQYLLNFQNPLEVVADEWQQRKDDISDLHYALQHVCDKQDALQGDYALVSDAPAQGEVSREQPEKKPSVLARLKAAREADQPASRPKAPGASKEEPR